MNDAARSGPDQPQADVCSPPAGWRCVPIGPVRGLPLGVPCRLENGRDSFAVVRFSDGRLVAFDDVCPHAGGDLASGEVCHETIVCPWHGWRFRLSDGRCPERPTVGVALYPTHVNDQGEGFVHLPVGRPPNGPPIQVP